VNVQRNFTRQYKKELLITETMLKRIATKESDIMKPPMEK
jgi:hypothetical protein